MAAALAVLRGGMLTFVDEVAPTAVVAATWSGREVSLHATSTGKVVLAWSSSEARRRLLSEPLESFTATTITSAADLDEELRRTRRRGWASCEGKFDAAAYGVSAPVLGPTGDLLAVLSIWGPQGRVTPDRFDALGALTVEASRRITG